MPRGHSLQSDRFLLFCSSIFYILVYLASASGVTITVQGDGRCVKMSSGECWSSKLSISQIRKKKILNCQHKNGSGKATAQLHPSSACGRDGKEQQSIHYDSHFCLPQNLVLCIHLFVCLPGCFFKYLCQILAASGAGSPTSAEGVF